MSKWKEFGKPVAVLLTICLLAGVVLAGVNAMTADAIAANEAAEATAAYYEALPTAEGFEELDCDIDGVTAVLRATNGVGYVVTAEAKGYGGQVPAAVAISPEGVILNVVMMENDETAGLGQKVRESAFSDQFAGMAAEAFTIDDIDAISGATISSRAAVSAINLAIEAYQQVTEGADGNE